MLLKILSLPAESRGELMGVLFPTPTPPVTGSSGAASDLDNLLAKFRSGSDDTDGPDVE